MKETKQRSTFYNDYPQTHTHIPYEVLKYAKLIYIDINQIINWLQNLGEGRNDLGEGIFDKNILL